MAAKGRTPTPRLNPASAARAGKWVIAVSLAAAFAGCAGTRVATVYLPSVCVDDQQRPELISRACATGQVGIDKIHWIGWGSPRAVGHGFAYHNDCRPACNGGGIHYSPVAVYASAIVICPNGKHQYSQLVVDPLPPYGFGPVTAIPCADTRAAVEGG